MKLRRFLLVEAAPMLAAVLVTAVIGPYGTFQALSLGDRLLYWGLMIGVGSLIFEGVIRLGLLIPWLRRRWLLLAVGGVVIGAAPLTEFVRRAAVWFDSPSPPMSWAELYGYVVILTIPISAVPLWLETQARRKPGAVETPPAPAPAAEAEPALPSPPRRWRRLPDVAMEALYALETQDHYLKAHHAGGSTLILCRMADAEADLADWPGRRAHRSWWVADAAVTRCDKLADGRALLTLCNGLTVPVSRTYAPAWRAVHGAEG